MSHSGGWQVGEGPGGGDKKAGDEATAVGIHRNLSGGSAVRDKRARCSGHPRGQITAPSACASSSFSTAPEGRSQVTSSGAPRATGGSERCHPGLVTDACRWATQVPRSVDTLLEPPTALAFEVPLEAKLYACSSLLPPAHNSAQLCHTSPQWVLSATALDGLQHDSDTLLAPIGLPFRHPGPPSLSFLSQGPPTAPIILCGDMLSTPPSRTPN